MTQTNRMVRVGFVVVKLGVGRDAFFLARLDPRWRDVNFIGGHEAVRDGGDLARTARRELWEEVPSVRTYSNFDLEPLTDVVRYGPVKSASRGSMTIYDAQFFLLRIHTSPLPLVELLSHRSKNVWLTQSELIRGKPFRVSAFVRVLNECLEGGLDQVAFSSPVDLTPIRARFERSDGKQLNFAFR